MNDTGDSQQADRELAPGEAVASIVRDLTDIWVSQARRWYDRVPDTDEPVRPETLALDSMDLLEHLTPVAERSIDLGIELLRPWAVAYQERRSDG